MFLITISRDSLLRKTFESKSCPDLPFTDFFPPNQGNRLHLVHWDVIQITQATTPKRKGKGEDSWVLPDFWFWWLQWSKLVLHTYSPWEKLNEKESESSLEYTEFEMPRIMHVGMLRVHGCTGLDLRRPLIRTLQFSDSTSEDALSKCSPNFGLKAILVLK